MLLTVNVLRHIFRWLLNVACLIWRVDAFLRSIRDITATAQVGEEFEALKLALELVVTQLQH
jgi:hypothetical protein